MMTLSDIQHRKHLRFPMHSSSKKLLKDMFQSETKKEDVDSRNQGTPCSAKAKEIPEESKDRVQDDSYALRCTKMRLIEYMIFVLGEPK